MKERIIRLSKKNSGPVDVRMTIIAEQYINLVNAQDPQYRMDSICPETKLAWEKQRELQQSLVRRQTVEPDLMVRL